MVNVDVSPVRTNVGFAEMLAVRRQTVVVIAGALQAAGFIHYRRGVMRILDREGLEAGSCECYQISNSYYERIVHPPQITRG